jgi:cytochrome c5
LTALLAAPLLSLACGSAHDEDNSVVAGDAGCAGAAPRFPREVAAAIEAKCQRCHAQPPQNGAPFPLLTWEDTHASYGQQLVYQAMLPAIEKGIMPFTELKLDPPVEPLTADEKALLLNWLGDGAPPAEAAACN